MTIFLDTNVVLDYLTGREPFVDDAESVVELSTHAGNRGVVTALTACNVIYVLAKVLGRVSAEVRLDEFLSLVELVGIAPDSVRGNLRRLHPDFEDAVQLSEAVNCHADVIVTRDRKGFQLSTIPVLSPAEFLDRFV